MFLKSLKDKVNTNKVLDTNNQIIDCFSKDISFSNLPAYHTSILSLASPAKAAIAPKVRDPTKIIPNTTKSVI